MVTSWPSTPPTAPVCSSNPEGTTRNDGYTSTPLRQALFTPSNSSRYFVSIRGVFATRDIDYTVALVEPAPDDIPASTSTPAEGNSSNGVIEKLYDVDWHRTDNLSAGTEYVVYLKGADANGLFDPFIVGIYNPQGDLIEGNSDNRRGIGKRRLRRVHPAHVRAALRRRFLRTRAVPTQGQYETPPARDTPGPTP